MTQRTGLADLGDRVGGDSWPWSWAAFTPERWTMSTTRFGSSSRNTPTVRISGGSRRVMS